MKVARAEITEGNDTPVTVASAEPAKEAPKVAASEKKREPVRFSAPVQVALNTPKPEILSPTLRVEVREEQRQARAKPRAERVASKSRPNRAARIAMAKSRPGNRNRVALANRAPSVVKETRSASAEGTNDSLSVFTRHGRPEMPTTFRQAQAEQRARARVGEYRSRQVASLHRGRDRDDS
jgi:hypothetical protein